MSYKWTASGGRYTDLHDASPVQVTTGMTRTWTFQTTVINYSPGEGDGGYPTYIDVLYSRLINDPGSTSLNGSWTLQGTDALNTDVCVGVGP